jgi:hypothetical protein
MHNTTHILTQEAGGACSAAGCLQDNSASDAVSRDRLFFRCGEKSANSVRAVCWWWVQPAVHRLYGGVVAGVCCNWLLYYSPSSGACQKASLAPTLALRWWLKSALLFFEVLFPHTTHTHTRCHSLTYHELTHGFLHDRHPCSTTPVHAHRAGAMGSPYGRRVLLMSEGNNGAVLDPTHGGMP